MILTSTANIYGWQIAFMLAWAKSQDKLFYNEHELVKAYMEDIEMPVAKNIDIYVDLSRKLIIARYNEENSNDSDSLTR
jgi:hypothetical protein